MAEPGRGLGPGARVGALDAAALRTAACALAARLPAPAAGSQVAFAFDHDLAAFAVALLATWQRGHAVALPASPRRRHLGPVLAEPATAVLLHDTGAGLGIDVARLLAAGLDGGASGAAPWPEVAGRLRVFAPDGTAQVVDGAALAAQVQRAVEDLALRPGLVVAHVCPPAAPEAMVEGLLAPLCAGAAVATDAARADVVIAPRALAATFASGGARLVAVDRAPEPAPPHIERRPLEFETVAPLDGETARFRTTVPVDFFGFAGHFDGYPVLSGAVQLHELVLPCLRAAGHGGAVAAFHDLKFLARIGPGDTVDMALRAAPGRCEFTILRGATRCSTGRAELASAGHA